MMLQIWPDGVVHFTPVRVVHIVPESLVHYSPVEVVHYTPVCSENADLNAALNIQRAGHALSACQVNGAPRPSASQELAEAISTTGCLTQ